MSEIHAHSDAEVKIAHTHFWDSCFELHALYIYMSRYLAQLWNLHEDSLSAKSIILWIMLLLLSLKSINHEWWGLNYLWVYMYVHYQSKFKDLLTKVCIVTRYSCRCKYLKYFLQGMPLLLLLFLSSKQVFFVLSYDFQVWICDMPMLFNCRHLLSVQDRWSCELIAMKSGNRLMFFGCIVTKSFNKVNISEKNLQC